MKRSFFGVQAPRCMTIRFLLFLLAQAVSEFGSAASAAGLATLWATQGAPATELALVLAIPALPALVLAPVIGSLMEGARLKRALIFINVLLGLTSLGAAGAFLLPQREAVLALTGLFVLKALCQSAFNGAYNRAFRLLAPGGGVEGRAVSLQTLSNRLGTAVGAGLGAIIALKAGSAVFIVDAATFGVATLVVAALPLGMGAPARSPGGPRLAPLALLRDVAVAVRYVMGSPRLMRVFALYAPMTLVWAAWDILGAYLLRQAGAPEAFGTVVIAAQVGEIAVATGLAAINARFTVALVLAATLLLALATGLSGLVVTGHTVLGVAGTLALLVALRLVTGATSNISGGGVYALLVYSAPAGLTSRLTALVESLGIGAMFALAKLGVGILGDAIGPSQTFMVAGILAGALGFGLSLLEFQARSRETAVLRLRMEVYQGLRSGGMDVAAFRYLIAQTTH